MVVINGMASLSLKDAVSPNALGVPAAVLARTTEGPEICTHHTSRIV